ncbi:MAG: hypothetical protein V4550_05020 [Gemmatimonadota bacterium]
MRTFLVLALLATISAPAAAQLVIDPRLVATITAQRPGDLLRLETKGIHEGRLLGSSADSVRLAESDTTRQVALRDINVVSRQGNQWAKGARIGGITGGVVGAVLSALLFNVYCNHNCHNTIEFVEVTAYGAALVGVPSALLGAGIGALSHGWQSVYRKE